MMSDNLSSNSDNPMLQLMETTVSLIMERDTAALTRLLEEVSDWDNHEVARRLMMDLVLGSDNLDIARALFDANIIEAWCFSNTTHVMEHCPRLFGHWASNTPGKVQCIANMLETHDDATKCNILDGRENRVGARYLREVLLDDPLQWKNLSLAWLGAPESPLRQAAIQAGWTSSRVSNMANHVFESRAVQEWPKTMPYPYSLAAASLGAHRIGQENERQRAWKQGVLAGKPLNKMVCTIQCDMDANPVDVALAQMLCQKTGLRGDFVAHPDAVGLPSRDLGHLACIVEMHLTTNSLDVLVENLAAGTLAGYGPQEHVDFPSLDGLGY